jgi:hypothetical protein
MKTLKPSHSCVLWSTYVYRNFLPCALPKVNPRLKTIGVWHSNNTVPDLAIGSSKARLFWECSHPKDLAYTKLSFWTTLCWLNFYLLSSNQNFAPNKERWNEEFLKKKCDGKSDLLFCQRYDLWCHFSFTLFPNHLLKLINHYGNLHKFSNF